MIRGDSAPASWTPPRGDDDDAHLRSYDALPSNSRIEARYEDFLVDPATELRRVIPFLGLQPRADVASAKSRPRARALHPAVATHRTGFVARLRRRELWRPGLASEGSLQ